MHDLRISPPAGLEPGTAIFKRCQVEKETLPVGTKMAKGDLAIAVRYLERASEIRDKQQLTFVEKVSTKPVLINAVALRGVLREKEGIKRVNAVVEVGTEQRKTRSMDLASATAELDSAALTEWLVAGRKENECLKICHRDVVE